MGFQDAHIFGHILNQKTYQPFVIAITMASIATLLNLELNSSKIKLLS